MIESEVRFLSVEALLAKATSRQRPVNPDKVREYATSIFNRGLIHTVLVERDTGLLIAGLHRCEAFRLLAKEGVQCNYPEYEGWTKIPSRLAYEVDDAEVEALELEENIRRHDLTWQEECDAVRRYHNLLCAMHGEGWTMDKTGKKLGMSHQNISRYLLVGEELTKENTRIKSASSLHAAVGILNRQLERALANEMETLRETHIEEVEKNEPKREEEVVLNLDFTKWLQTYSGPKFNFIHCDFPYGVNMQNSEQGRAAVHGEYDDTPETFWKLFEAFFENLDRFCSKSAHIMFWFSMNYYEQIMRRLHYEEFSQQYDLVVDPFPLIWFKSDNKGILPDRERGPRRVYETALLISRGDRKIIQAVANVYAAPTTKELHLSEKPESVLRHFFRMFVDDQTSILDPTCGSGTALRAADSLGADRILGLEISPEHSAAARDAFNRERNLRILSKQARL